MTNEVHEIVRERYAAAATHAATGTGACCGPEDGIGAELYSALERDELPVGAEDGVEAGTVTRRAIRGDADGLQRAALEVLDEHVEGPV